MKVRKFIDMLTACGFTISLRDSHGGDAYRGMRGSQTDPRATVAWRRGKTGNVLEAEVYIETDGYYGALDPRNIFPRLGRRLSRGDHYIQIEPTCNRGRLTFTVYVRSDLPDALNPLLVFYPGGNASKMAAEVMSGNMPAEVFLDWLADEGVI